MNRTDLLLLINLFLRDIEEGTNVTEMQKRERMKLLYLFETELEKIKQENNLPNLNNSINSRSVSNSFIKKTYVDWKGQLDVKTRPYLKTTDYQYWLLVFLLLSYYRIAKNVPKQYEVVDLFINRYKNVSFSYRDIELTKSGQTRCKTNIKFAFADLVRLGLVNPFSVMKEARWSLTYLGFILAVSIILDPDRLRRSAFSRFITPVKIENYHRMYSEIDKSFPWSSTLSSGYNPIDPFLLFRISQLRDIKYFNKIIKRAELEYLNAPILKEGSKIFSKYYGYVIENLGEKLSKEISLRNISLRYDQLDVEYKFYKFLKIISEELDAEAFLTNLIKSARGVTRENKLLRSN